ncbi:hypothetical protein ES288_A03G258200v1 [Gossypium darwinii]|uniref:TF-B3 domain-containing protein n=1 Tax=Gossypium darwinii TaxID=34276 RepID=A0A5D2HAJ0_GOSDA|nr:hypothetical protein ES288_A03G258200v1 [Gossypium darwinii]
MILSGEHWWKLRSTYAIEDGYRITIESISNNDYKIVEVSRSLTVIDERRRPWTFDYRVTRRGRVLSGPHWQNFIRDYNVRVGGMVSIERNDGHGYPAEYKIEVSRN